MVVAGQGITASLFNDLERRIAVCESLSGEAPIEVTNSPGSKSIRLTTQPIYAKITGVSGLAYSWVQVVPQATGLWNVVTNGYVGTLNAYEDNNNTTPVDTIVELTNVFTNEWRFIYSASTSGTGITLACVTNVCDSITSGVVTGITVEFTPITFPAGTTSGTPVCITNSSGCCGGSTSGCSQCPVAPANWLLVFSGFADTAAPVCCGGGGHCTSINGVGILLPYFSDCSWVQFSNYIVCSGINMIPVLNYSSGAWTIGISFGTMGATLNLVGGTFNCFGENVFSGALTGFPCELCAETTITATIIPA